MTAIEDRLRAAAQAAADTVPAGSAPPLRLPAQSGASFSLPGWLRRAASRRVVAPVTAAAAVAAVVTVSLVVTGGVPRSGPARVPGGTAASCATSSATPSSTSSGTPSTTASATASTSPGATTPGAVSSTRLPAPDPSDPSAPAALAEVPPYYVALTRPTGSAAVVRATATGAVLATLTPPSPYGMFSGVTAAADDRTFVLAAQPSPTSRQDGDPTGFFLLCLNPAGQPTAGLTALPIPAESAGGTVTGIALSPDGSRLAVVVRKGSSASENSEIVVYTLATGSATQWQWATSGWIGNWKPFGSPLSWTANGQMLAFQAWREVQTPLTRAAAPRLHQKVKVSLTTEVRLLDADGPGGSLASSTLVVEWAASGSYLLGTNTIITPDGTEIVCVTGTQSSLSSVATEQPSGVATEYSVSTGKIVGFLGGQLSASSPASTPRVSRPVQDVLWSSTTGSTLIVATSTGAGVLTGDQFTPIPGYPPLTWNAAW
jgi:hypothetical protein